MAEVDRFKHIVLHALSSYKDHPYKDQVVNSWKNKDQ